MRKKYLFVSLLAVMMLAGVAWAWTLIERHIIDDYEDGCITYCSLDQGELYHIVNHGGYKVHVKVVRQSDNIAIIDTTMSELFDQIDFRPDESGWYLLITVNETIPNHQTTTDYWKDID